MAQTRRRLLAGVLAVALVFGLLSLTAYADDASNAQPRTSQYNDETAAETIPGTVLNTQEQAIYADLKNAIQQVANGQTVSTILIVRPSGNQITYDRAHNTISGIDPKRLLEVLLIECPYDLYWFDKSTTGGMGISLNTNASNIVTELRFSFAVSADYAGTSPYTINPSKIHAAVAAAQEAHALVARTTGTDYEILQAYMNYICDAVSYNAAATRSDYGGSYGAPWQLIDVFDNDPTTNVVCEGYAKAFQYLCDLTTFSDAVCYTVTGTVYGGNQSGAHMWNIVTMGDGNSYLVDLTNRDICNGVDSSLLSLVGTTPNSNGSYTFRGPICNVTYVYDSNSYDLYGTDAGSILYLADTNYVPSSDAE